MACLLKLKKFFHRAFPIVLTIYCVCGFSLYTVAYLYVAAHPVTAPARSHQSDLDIDDDFIVHGTEGNFVFLNYASLEYSEDYTPSSMCIISSGSTFTVLDRLKFLPGGVYVIEEGAELILDRGKLYFYCADDYLDTYNYIGWTSNYDAILLNYGTITCKNGGAIYSSDPEWSNIYGYDGDDTVEDTAIYEYQNVYNPIVGESDYNYGSTSVPFYSYARTASSGGDDGSGSTDTGDAGDSGDSGDTGGVTDMDSSITGDFSTFGSFMSATLSVFQTEFTLFGFTLSYWEVFLWSAIAGIIIIIVRRILDG